MIFKPAARYPADPRAVFILALSVFSGLTALVLEQAPDSLLSVLPRWAVVTWGVMLTLGSLITLVGMKYQSVNGILAEQFGSALVAATTIFYSGVVFVVVGGAGIQTVGIILAWGLACTLRWIQLQVLIHNGIKRAEKIAVLQALEDAFQERQAERQKHHGWWEK